MASEEILIKLKVDDDKASKSLESVKTSTKETGNAAKSAAGEFRIMGVSLNGVKSAFSKIIPIAKGMFSTIKAGIASTGIGLLVIAIGSLITHFTNTKRGSETLQVAFKAVGAAIAVITDRISSIGNAIVKVFKGDFKGAAEDAKNAVTGLGAEIVKETKQMIELTRTLQSVRDKEREFGVERAKTNKVIAEARLLAEDETKTYEERLAALSKANDLEISTTEKAIALQKEKLEAKRQEVELGESLAEDFDELAQLEIELIDMETASFMTRKRLLTAEETLKTEQAAAENARIKEIEATKAAARKKEEEAEKARQAATKKQQEEEAKLAKQLEDDALKQAELAIQVSEQKIQTSANAAGQIANLAGRETAFGKAAAVAQATINTYQGATKDIAQGGFLGILTAALTVAAGLSNVAKIVSTETPKYAQPTPNFAQGGMVGGIGSGTSDSVSARLSKGESVINAKSTRMFRPLLSAINEAGGGTAFADSGTIEGGTMGVTGGTVKAYVVADEMSNSQDRLTKIRRRATI